MTVPFVLMPEQIEAIAALIKDKVALTAECGRLRTERDGLANAVGLFFKAKDLYGEAPPDSIEERHAAARVEDAVDAMLRAAAAIAVMACKEGE